MNAASLVVAAVAVGTVLTYLTWLAWRDTVERDRTLAELASKPWTNDPPLYVPSEWTRP